MISEEIYSSMGQWEVVPFIALNKKQTLTVAQEIRTQRDRASSYSWVPTMLSSVAGLLTGGVSTHISRLAGYAQKTHDIVNTYDQHSQESRKNRLTLFDNATNNSYEEFRDKGTLLWFSAFGNGADQFRVWEIDRQNKQRKKIKIKEPAYQDIEFDWNNDHPTHYRIVSSTPTQENYEERLANVPDIQTLTVQHADRSLQNATYYYPTGEDPYIILKFERYIPYPNLARYPAAVPGVAPHFDSLNKILKANRTTVAGAAGAATNNYQNLIDTEGEELIETLKELTDNGDLSLTDANIVMTTFITKATAIPGTGAGFNPAYLKALNAFPTERDLLPSPESGTAAQE